MLSKYSKTKLFAGLTIGCGLMLAVTEYLGLASTHAAASVGALGFGIITFMMALAES